MITPDELEILRKPEVQGYIRECQGDPKGYDQFHCLTCGAYFQQKDGDCHCNDYDSEKWIVIPDCISRDSSRPERGLWGMLLAFHYPNLHYNAYANEWVVDLIEKDTLTRVGFHHADTPRLALLKALLWQIERGK